MWNKICKSLWGKTFGMIQWTIKKSWTACWCVPEECFLDGLYAFPVNESKGVALKIIPGNHTHRYIYITIIMIIIIIIYYN